MVDRLLPLQEPTFYILLSLRGGEKHGYAILKDVAELSEGRIQLSTGTLYGALNRLLDQGLIDRIEPADPDSGVRGKKAYRLTLTGLEAFDAEVSRIQRLLRAVKAQVRPNGGLQR